MSANQPRKPAGTPVGGQWAPAAHTEADIDLSRRHVDHAEARRRIDDIATLFDDLPQDDFRRSSVWDNGGYYSPFAAGRDVAQDQLRRLVPSLGFDPPPRRTVNALSKKFAAQAEKLQSYRNECEKHMTGPDWAQDRAKRGIEWADLYVSAYWRASVQLSELAKGLPPAPRPH
jgi:hypothetical protein